MAALVIAAADVEEVSDLAVAGKLGEPVDAGDMLVWDNETERWLLADGLTPAAAHAFAMGDGNAEQTIAIVSTRGAEIEVGDVLAVPQVYCVSNTTPGKIVPVTDLAPGDSVFFVGYSKSDSRLYLMLQNAGFEVPGS